MKEAVDVAVRLQSNKLKEEVEAENQEFFNQVDSTMKAIIKEHVKAQVSKIMSQIEKYVTESLGAEVLDPFVGSDRGTKRRKSSKNAEPSKGSKSKESKSSSSFKGTQSQPKSSDDQPDNEADPKHDWFRSTDKPPTPDRAWNKSKSIDSRPPQKWISTIAKARQPPRTFDELMDTPIDFSAYVMNSLKVDNLTQEILYYKAVNDRLDWHNPEGREYLFDLSKPLSLIEDQERQVVPTDDFINNDLEYLKEIVVRRDDNVLYKFKEGDFPRLNLCDIEDMLLLLVQKKLSNLDVDDRYDLGVALRMFTRRIVILHRVQDLQLGVESYQKKLNITRPETTRSNISKLTPYTAYKNPQGIIYQDKYKRNRLMRSDELYKFCDGTLSSVRRVLHDIASNLEMDYLPKRHWSNLEMKRSRIMVKAIDKLLFERRLMRNLEKFVGGRDYGNDLRLLERTI
ncbi:hypothetical protein Tco_0946823 [Tanacetum coccineum]